MRLSHETLPSPTRPATTVADSGLETEASWKTVSASDGRGLADLAHTEGVEQDDLVAIDDSDREPGHELFVHDLPGEFLELGQRGRDLLLGRRLRTRGQGNEQRRNASEQRPPDNRAAWINAQGHGVEVTESALPGAAEMGSRPTDATREGRSRCGVRVCPLC